MVTFWKYVYSNIAGVSNNSLTNRWIYNKYYSSVLFILVDDGSGSLLDFKQLDNSDHAEVTNKSLYSWRL